MGEDLTASSGGARWTDIGPSDACVASTFQKSRMGIMTAHRGGDLARIERAIDLRRLRYFVNIVAEGSFSTAAERLCVAQPALSHHVRELEAILGVTLLTRSVHGVAPTEAGHCLYDHALEILAKVGEAAAELGAFNADASRQVRVGMDGASASMLSAPLVEALQARSPGVKLMLAEASGPEICKGIEGRRLDIALLFDAPESKMLARHALLTDKLCLVGPPGDADGDVTFSEAARLPLILPSQGNRVRDRLDRAAKATDVELNVVFEIDGTPSTKKLIRAGVGLSVMAAAEIEDEQALGLLQKRAIVDPDLVQTLSLCTARDGKASRDALFVRALISEIVEEAHARTRRSRSRPTFVRNRRPTALAYA